METLAQKKAELEPEVEGLQKAIDARQARIDSTQDRINQVFDRLYASLSKKVPPSPLEHCFLASKRNSRALHGMRCNKDGHFQLQPQTHCLSGLKTARGKVLRHATGLGSLLRRYAGTEKAEV